MQCNVGKIDRNLRITTGLALIGGGLMAGTWWGAIGLIPLVTGLVGWCPAYHAAGIDTGHTPRES